MDKLDQAIAALKAENKRLERELKQVRSPIAALQGITNNGRGIKGRLSGRTMSASARRRIAAAQKARWNKVEGGNKGRWRQRHTGFHGRLADSRISVGHLKGGRIGDGRHGS